MAHRGQTSQASDPRPILIELPASIYERVERAATGLNQPLAEALIRIVEHGLPSLGKVPVEYRAELETLEPLGDGELWRVARSELPAEQQALLDDLLERNQDSVLGDEEVETLERLHLEVNRLMLRKSYASTLLKWRGHAVRLTQQN